LAAQARGEVCPGVKSFGLQRGFAQKMGGDARDVRPHPGPMASQARHESVAPKEVCASRNVVPQEREKGRHSSLQLEHDWFTKLFGYVRLCSDKSAYVRVCSHILRFGTGDCSKGQQCPVVRIRTHKYASVRVSTPLGKIIFEGRGGGAMLRAPMEARPAYRRGNGPCRRPALRCLRPSGGSRVARPYQALISVANDNNQEQTANGVRKASHAARRTPFNGF
jgi:hypothetical protein